MILNLPTLQKEWGAANWIVRAHFLLDAGVAVLLLGLGGLVSSAVTISWTMGEFAQVITYDAGTGPAFGFAFAALFIFIGWCFWIQARALLRTSRVAWLAQHLWFFFLFCVQTVPKASNVQPSTVPETAAKICIGVFLTTLWWMPQWQIWGRSALREFK